MSQTDSVTTRIERPVDTEMLSTQLRKLTMLSDPSLVQRAECASIAHLLFSEDGCVRRDQVSLLTCTLLGVSYNEASIEYASYVLGVVETVWSHISDLSAGIWPAEIVEARTNTQLPNWLSRAVERMDRELNSGQLNKTVIVNALPDSVRQYAAYSLISNEYGSPYALGHSLATMKVASFGNLTFGDKGQVAWFADAMATTLLEAIDVFCHEEAHTESAQVELGKIVIWTMILKAYIYGLVDDNNQDQAVFRVMAENMVIVEHIHAALLAGIRHIENSRQAQHMPIPAWEGRTTTHDKKIEDADPDELLSKLDTLVARTADNMNSSTQL